MIARFFLGHEGISSASLVSRGAAVCSSLQKSEKMDRISGSHKTEREEVWRLQLTLNHGKEIRVPLTAVRMETGSDRCQAGCCTIDLQESVGGSDEDAKFFGQDFHAPDHFECGQRREISADGFYHGRGSGRRSGMAIKAKKEPDFKQVVSNVLDGPVLQDVIEAAHATVKGVGLAVIIFRMTRQRMI